MTFNDKKSKQNLLNIFQVRYKKLKLKSLVKVEFCCFPLPLKRWGEVELYLPLFNRTAEECGKIKNYSF